MPHDPSPVAAATSSSAEAAALLAGDAARTAAARRLRPDRALPGLDRLAELAAQLLGTPSAQVSLLTDVETVAAGTGPQVPGVGDDGPLAQSLCSLTAASGTALVVPDAPADARVAHLLPVASGAVGAYLGVPLTTGGGDVVGALCVQGPQPRTWSGRDVDVLQQVAVAVGAELELAALGDDYRTSKALLEVSVTAAGIGVFDLDLGTGVLTVDDRLLELSGLTRRSFSGRPQDVYANLHPDDVEETVARVQAAVAGGGDYAAQYRVVERDGSHRWLAARGAALPGPDGRPARLVGAVHDITGVRRAAEHVEAILDAMAVGYLALDADWRITYANAEAVRIAHYDRDQLLGTVFWERFPAAVGSPFEEAYRRAVATAQPVVFDAWYPEPVRSWVEVRAIPEGRGLGLYFHDITARKQAQQAAERAAARLALLARVSSSLTGTLDAEQAVARLAQLVVPALGDWCVVTLVDDAAASALTATDPSRTADLRRGVRDVGSWHRDPALRPLVEAYSACRLAELDDRAPVLRALREVRPAHLVDATAAITALLDPDGRAVHLLAELAPATASVFPLRGRGRTVGVLTVFSGPERPPLSAEEVAVAEEVATRAGTALDSARLYRQQRNLAEGLQRALLSEPPEPDHGQIVVRYVPAAEAAQVGGDWYDAFLQPNGATVLVIGDVVGHDTQAAAAMSQVRTIVRAFGSVGDDSPAQVLTLTDRVMANLQMPTTATAIAARLEQEPDERTRGVTRLHWSNAGHPPAMVVHPDGSVLPLLGLHADLLLGVLPDTARQDYEVVLDRGSTVVLYTDGLVERRDQDLGEGLEALRAVLGELAAEDLDLDTLVDRLLERMLPPHREDDVAVVAVRLHAQDRPRPAEAGPNRLPPHVPPEPAIPAGSSPSDVHGG